MPPLPTPSPQLDSSRCSTWCNVRGAGAGHVPTMNTGLPSVVDAFFWVKIPGESDGCTHTLPRRDDAFDGATADGDATTQILRGSSVCPRFDSSCESADSIGGLSTEPRAPEAGQWFEYQARELARHSSLRLDAPGALDSTYYGRQSSPRGQPMVNRLRAPPPPALQTHNAVVIGSGASTHGSVASTGTGTGGGSVDTTGTGAKTDVTGAAPQPQPLSRSNEHAATSSTDQQKSPGAQPSYVPAGMVSEAGGRSASSTLVIGLGASLLLLGLLVVGLLIVRGRWRDRRSRAVKATSSGVQMQSRARRSRLPLQDQDEAQEVRSRRSRQPLQDQDEAQEVARELEQEEACEEVCGGKVGRDEAQEETYDEEAQYVRDEVLDVAFEGQPKPSTRSGKKVKKGVRSSSEAVKQPISTSRRNVRVVPVSNQNHVDLD